MKKIWSIGIVVAGLAIILHDRKYSNLMSIISLGVPLFMALIFYLIRKKYVEKVEYYIKDSTIQYINFSANEVFQIHYGDVIKIIIESREMEFYLVDEPVGSVWSKRKKNKIKITSEVDELLKEMEKYEGWKEKLKEA